MACYPVPFCTTSDVIVAAAFASVAVYAPTAIALFFVTASTSPTTASLAHPHHSYTIFAVITSFHLHLP